MADLVWMERVGTDSPTTAGFSVKGGRVQGSYTIEPTTAADIVDGVSQIIGRTAILPGDGRLRRTMPCAHPQYAWMVATNISNIQGKGKYELTAAQPELETAPITQQYALYDRCYEYRVDFTPPIYPIKPDTNIYLNYVFWYDDFGTLQRSVVCNEWDRYCTFVPCPPDASSFITMQQGEMVFKTTGAAAPGGNNGATFIGSPRMYLPDQLLRVTWYQVPFRYVSSPNSYLNRWRGRINQGDWVAGGYYFPKGSLLYLDYATEIYTPPVPEEVVNAPGVYSTDKLVNIEMRFLWTTRTSTDAPAGPSTGNRNYVVAGHNLLPWFRDRSFHYAEARGYPDVPGAPAWLSFPVQTLFFDPDVIYL